MGPIPARAGQPLPASCISTPTRAYPRTSGATWHGVHPEDLAPGLSPHERGNLLVKMRVSFRAGPIPARAGQPLERDRQLVRIGAYPRTSGATGGIVEIDAALKGLSPHERGNREGRVKMKEVFGPIPARAGQPPTRYFPTPTPRAYPRTSGATHSPHERGNPSSTDSEGRTPGPIPARAGQPQ